MLGVTQCCTLEHFHHVVDLIESILLLTSQRRNAADDLENQAARSNAYDAFMVDDVHGVKAHKPSAPIVASGEGV